MDAKPKYGQQVLVLLLLFVGFTIVGSCLMLVAQLFGADIADPKTMLVLQGLSQLVSFVLPPVLLAVIYRHDMRQLFQLDFSTGKWGLGLVGLVILVLAMPICDWVAQWNDGWHFGSGVWGKIESSLREMNNELSATTEKLLYADNVGRLVFNLVVVALIPAVCEELFFRGALQQLLSKWFRQPHVAVVVTAVVFGLAHGELFALMPRIVLGLLLGYLFFYGGSMVVNSMVHFMNNAMVVVLYYLSQQGLVGLSPDEPLNVMWQWTALFTVAAIGLFYANFVMDHSKSKNL
ncbi:MAG: CPBP family intramembrane metalloprotease [Bacteroidales bacterium]|nr:CPBP family intramembrane metalloprotease [Bacteroidales bacterium]